MQSHIENIYALVHGPEHSPSFLYVGKTVSDIDTYFKHVHYRNCQNGIEKRLYEEWRHLGLDAVRITLLDTTESGLTEADYVRTLTDEGHTLLNDNKGNTKVAAKTSSDRRLYRTLNAEAEKLLAAPVVEGSGKPFEQSLSYDEAMSEWKSFFELTLSTCKTQ